MSLLLIVVGWDPHNIVDKNIPSECNNIHVIYIYIHTHTYTHCIYYIAKFQFFMAKSRKSPTFFFWTKKIVMSRKTWPPGPSKGLMGPTSLFRSWSVGLTTCWRTTINVVLSGNIQHISRVYGGLMEFNGIYPLVMTNIAIENGHRNSGWLPTDSMVIFQFCFVNCKRWNQRVYTNTYLVGGIPTPLKNDGVRQLGWWQSQLNGKKMFQTTNQISN